MTIKRLMLGTIFTAAILSLAVGTLEARTISGAAGRAQSGNLDTCFDVASDDNTGKVGWAANRCGSAVELMFSLPVDTFGARTVKVTVWAPDKTATYCAQYAAAKDGTGTSGGGNKTAGVSNSTSDIILDGTFRATVPTGGMLWVKCHVGPGASVSSVNYVN